MKKSIAAILIASMVLSVTACEKEEKKKRKKANSDSPILGIMNPDNDGDDDEDKDKDEHPDPTPTETPAPTLSPTPTPTKAPSGNNPSPSGTSDELTLYCLLAGVSMDPNNVIQEEIAGLTGVTLKDYYLSGITDYEAVDMMIASGEYPELVYGSSENIYDLYYNGALIPWDDYLADPAYANLKSLYTDAEWELFRMPDGHIYYVDPFAAVNGESAEKDYTDEAFWIQVRVLEWAGYPLIETVDDYFTLLDAYYQANPEDEHGADIIPFTMITESWRVYTLQNPPMVTQGYFDTGLPIDYSDPNHPVLEDIGTNDDTMRYFKILNEAYKDGLIDPDFINQTYDDYITLLCSGRVLGMYDYGWDFIYTASYMLEDDCQYVPLALTLDPGMENHYYNSNPMINTGSGLCVTTGCYDPSIAFGYLNRILDQDIHDLRFWGIEGEDYLVDDSTGVYYRTDNMRQLWSDYSYGYTHECRLDYLPSFGGMSRDGVNVMKSEDSAEEFLSAQVEPVRKCLEAYGCDGFTDMVHATQVPRAPWLNYVYYLNSLTYDTDGGEVYMEMRELQYEYLPKLVIAKDFDAVWKEYVDEYNDLDLDTMMKELQQGLNELEG